MSNASHIRIMKALDLKAKLADDLMGLGRKFMEIDPAT